MLALSRTTSILDRSPQEWLRLAEEQGWRDLSCMAFVRYAHTRVADLAAGAGPDDEYERDTWDSRRLGFPTRSASHLIRFGSIEPAWLRQATKRWARFRLATGRAVGTVSQDVLALARFASFLAQSHPGDVDESAITRQVVEHYLSWLASAPLADQTRLGYLVSLRIFIDHCRRHGWLPRLPAETRLYQEDFPAHGEYLPRFIPEFVMSQLESDGNLARIPDATTRRLIIVLIETGLRSSDACHITVDAVVDDSVGWPCLRFYNSKVRTEQLVPLSPRAAVALRDQATFVRGHWPAATHFLFPRERANPDGAIPFSYATLESRLRRWQTAIDVRDENGLPFIATAHQFRHTLGTRMINSGVPEHIVQKLLGHKTAQMTARYAHLHDSTLRRAFDDYCLTRVNIAGEVLRFDPDSPAAAAEWVKHRLSRAQDTLPNGFCGRPPQQDCPHPNACLTCADFQTTPEFLPVHRQQADNTRILIATAEANGQFRLAANHRQVLESLERIIPALETLEKPGDAS
jgi:integrase